MLFARGRYLEVGQRKAPQGCCGARLDGFYVLCGAGLEDVEDRVSAYLVQTLEAFYVLPFDLFHDDPFSLVLVFLVFQKHLNAPDRFSRTVWKNVDLLLDGGNIGPQMLVRFVWYATGGDCS